MEHRTIENQLIIITAAIIACLWDTKCLVYHSLQLTEGDDVLWKLRGLQSVSHSEKSLLAQLKQTKIVPSFTAN